MTFIPLDANLRPFGAPPSMGRRENAALQTPHEDGLRYENTTSPHSSFRAKARHLFRSRQGKGCERNGKRETPYSLLPQKRYFMQTVPHRKRNTANKKAPSAALGMTIRKYSFPQRRCEITIISFSRSICRGGLAALIGVTGKPYPSSLSYHSHPIRPCGAPSPRREGCNTRIPSSKKRRRSRHEIPEP